MAETQSRQTKRLPWQETKKSAPDDDIFDDSELDQIFENPVSERSWQNFGDVGARRCVWESDLPANIARLRAQARLIAAYEESKLLRRPSNTADLIHHLDIASKSQRPTPRISPSPLSQLPLLWSPPGSGPSGSSSGST
jgi:hypothetical protein